MSTAERQADDITGPKQGRIVAFVVGVAGVDTFDLELAALNPLGASHPHYWRDRYITILVEGNDCQFCISTSAANPLTAGAAAAAVPTINVTRGAVIQAGKAPEIRIDGFNPVAANDFRYMHFASTLGCTVTIWASSPQ
tara:strand:+ start:175 stop:591 length:417 start_codon:yes stop_codon:yes gene_type:complete